MTKHANRFPFIAALAACAVFGLWPGISNAQNASVATPATTIGNEFDDSVITAKVKAALMSKDDVKSLDITVKTRKGEVMLSGFADNQAQIDRSIALAKGVEGVTGVDNQLSQKTGTQSVGNKIDDSVITTRIKSALLADAAIQSLDFSVTTRRGEVQLSGFVNNPVQMTHAIDVAKGIEGVSGVVNHMSLKK